MNNIIHIIINMEELIVKQVIINAISHVNQLGRMISELENEVNKRKDRSREEINALCKMSVDIFEKFEFVVKLFESYFILPDKIIDSISLLFIKYLGLIIKFGNILDPNLIGTTFPLITTFYSLKQNIGENVSEFIEKKWKFLEHLLIFAFSTIDNPQFDLQTHIKSILFFVSHIYFNLKSTEKKYKIMPGIVSKLTKLLSSNLKISSKLLNMLLRIINENLSIIVKMIEREHLNEKDIQNVISFFEFYFACILIIKNRVPLKEKYSKILPAFLQMNLNLLKCLNISKFNELLLQRQLSIESFYYKKIETIFQLLNQWLLCNNEYNSEFYVHFQKAFVNNCHISYLNENVKMLTTSICKRELGKIDHILLDTFGYLFLSMLSWEMKSELLFDHPTHTQNLFSDLLTSTSLVSTSSCDIKSIANQLFFLFGNFFKLKESIILEVANTYEITVSSINLQFAFQKLKKISTETLLDSQYVNLDQIEMVISLLYINYPEMYLFFCNLYLKELGKLSREFRNCLERVGQGEWNSLKAPFKKSLNDILSSFAAFQFVLFYPGNLASININDNNLAKEKSKIFAMLKQYSQFFISFLQDNQDLLELINLSASQIAMLNASLMTLSSFIIINNSALYTNKQEKNSLIMLALINYSNKISLLKYTSILLLHFISNDLTSAFQLKDFIISNFDFIVNTTIKKIIYFNSHQLNNQSLTNFKLDIMNFFNSLIQLLMEVNCDSLTNFYCGELMKYVQKLFRYIDINMKEKNYFAIECLVEIIERVTHFQSHIVGKVNEDFKINCYDEHVLQEIDGQSEKFVSYLKDTLGIGDCNIFRQVLMRISPLLLCGKGKVNILYKCIQIFQNLLQILALLPLKREEKVNFSTEDPENVIVKRAIGPVLHETWGYFLYSITVQKGNGATISNFKTMIHFFIQILRYYPKFFTEGRLFTDLLPVVEEAFLNYEHNYSFIQVAPLYEDFITCFLLEIVRTCNFSKKKKCLCSLLKFCDRTHILDPRHIQSIRDSAKDITSLLSTSECTTGDLGVYASLYEQILKLN